MALILTCVRLSLLHVVVPLSRLLFRVPALVAVQTGSGKTLAFGLPIVNQLLQETTARPEKALQALVLTPTRELALQICEHMTAMTKGMKGVGVMPLVGGMALAKQQRLLGRKPEIVVATPGRLWSMADDGDAHLSDLSHLRFLVFDEADRMVEKGHYKELHQIVDLILRQEKAAAAPAAAAGAASAAGAAGKSKPRRSPHRSKRQTFLFSATLTLEQAGRTRAKQRGGSNKRRKAGGGKGSGTALDDMMARVGRRGKPAVVDLTKGKGDADVAERKSTRDTAAALPSTLTLAAVECVEEDKLLHLFAFLREAEGRTLVFVNSIATARRVTRVMQLLRVPVVALHAQMQQRQRLKNLDRFKGSTSGAAIATDVAARGLDIPGVENVVHFHTSHTPEVFIHRAGRTARAQQLGFSLSLVAPTEQVRRTIRHTTALHSFALLRACAAWLHHTVPVPPAPSASWTLASWATSDV